MPAAIEYGMTPEQFWLDDMKLFDVYCKAYYRRLHNQSFVQAQYFDYSIAVELSNMWKKKGDKFDKFLEKPYDPFEQKQNKKALTSLEQDKRYRLSLMQWI